MRKAWQRFLCGGILAGWGFLAATGGSGAQEAVNGVKEAPLPPEVADPIVKVRLFKNGLAQIFRHIQIPGGGTYTVKNPPVPMHGTFWLNASAKIEAVSGMRKAAVNPDDPDGPEEDNPNIDQYQLQQLRQAREHALNNPYGNGYEALVKALKGQKATILLKSEDGKSEVFSGTVTGLIYSLLQMDTEGGKALLPIAQIAAVRAAAFNPPKPEKVNKPYLDLIVPDFPQRESTGLAVQMDYIGYGISWSPSYRIDLTDDAALKIEMQAILRNEIEDLTDVECELISGFPNIKYGTVPSLITPGVTLANFFNPNSNTGKSRHDMSQLMLNSDREMKECNEEINSGFALSAAGRNIDNTGGEAVDIFSKNIGKLSIKKNTSRYIPLESSSAPYEKVAVWNIPNSRDWLGRVQQRDRNRYNNDEPQEDEADSVWDAVKFKNPFTFPMTTAATSFYRDARFVGESISHFVSPGEEATINVTKALSVRASVVESEEGGQNDDNYQYIYGYRVQKRIINGELKIKNYRSRPVKLIITKILAGNLLTWKAPEPAKGKPDAKAEPSTAPEYIAPETRLTADIEQNINQIWELKWTLELQAGEEKVLPYRSQVLVAY